MPARGCQKQKTHTKLIDPGQNIAHLPALEARKQTFLLAR